MEELETKTRQLWEENRKFVGEFEIEKEISDKKYQDDLKAYTDLTTNSEKEYSERITCEIEAIRQGLLVRKDESCVSGLEERLRDAGKIIKPERDLLKDKNELSQNYVKQLKGLFEEKAYTVSGFFAAWLKDCDSQKQEPINWNEIEEKKKILEGYKSKSIRKERKRNSALDNSIKETEIRLKNEISEAYRRQKSTEDRQKYQFAFPALITEESHDSNSAVEVILPIDVSLKENDYIKNFLQKSFDGFETTPIEDGIIRYSIKSALNGETIAKLKSSLEENVKASGLNLEPKVYFASVKIESEHSPTRESEKKEAIGIKKEDGEKLYKLSEAEAILRMPEGMLWNRIYSPNLCDPNLKKMTVARPRGKKGKLKQTFLTQEGLDYLSKIKGISGQTQNIEKKVEAQRGHLSKERILEEGVEYVKEYFDKHGNVPTSISWDCKNIRHAWKDYWDNFKSFFKSMMRSHEGKEARKKIEGTLAFEGYSSYELAKKLKLSLSAVCSDLKETGVLTERCIRKNYDTLDKLRERQILDFERFEKDSVREKMLLGIISSLSKPENLDYLGLEGPNFGSLTYMAKLCKINSERSLVAEKNHRAYNAMRSIIHHSDAIEGGRLFKRLNLYSGDIADAVIDSKYASMKFNVVNMDYNGYFNDKKKETIRQLFEKNKFTDEAILLMSLNEQARALEMVKSDFESNDQYALATGALNKEAAEHGYGVIPLIKERYTCKKSPMLAMSFKLKRMQ